MTTAHPVEGQLLLVSETLPIDEIGSHILLRRHLAPLVNRGWHLVVASSFTPPAGDPLIGQHVPIVPRKRWWPPLRKTFWPSVLLRQRLQCAAVLRALRDTRQPTVVLGNLWDDLSLIAAEVARQRRWPLGIFLHDDELHWHAPGTSRRYLERKRAVVCKRAARIWSVSEQLAHSLDAETRLHCEILRPIAGTHPCPPPAWRDDFSVGPRIGYAGKTYGGFQALLRSLARDLQRCNGSLHLITDAENARLLDGAESNLRAQPFLPSAAEAARWLHAHCSAILVAHPLHLNGADPRWQMLRSSFPSKLTEYVQLGLPMVLIAEPGSEFGAWARSQPGAPFFSEIESPEVARYCASLRDRAGWTTAAAWTRTIAAGEFNPARIQRQFESGIEMLAAGASPA